MRMYLQTPYMGLLSISSMMYLFMSGQTGRTHDASWGNVIADSYSDGLGRECWKILPLGLVMRLFQQSRWGYFDVSTLNLSYDVYSFL